MKLIVLAVVVSIAVFRASCRERPQGWDLNDVDRNLSDITNLPEYSDFSDGDDLDYITDLPAGPKDEATTVEPDAFSNGPVDRVSTTEIDMAFPTIESGPDLVQGGFQNYNSSDIDYQWRKDETVQNELQLRGGSKCKSDIICSLLGGSCVSNSTFCSGREVLSICGGAKCKCCFTVNMEVKMHDLEDEFRTMVVNLTVANSKLNTRLESLMNFMISSNSSQATVNSDIKNDLEFIIGNVTSANSNMQIELQFIKENFTVAIANQGLKLDSIRKNLGCPEGLFLFAPTNQCLRFLQDSKRTYDASKAACKALGLELAVLPEPIPVRSYLVTKYGAPDAIWIGARGDGSNVKWERTGVVIPKNSPLWYHHNPGVTTNHCICMLTRTDWLKQKPNQPYHPCWYTDGRYSLCELVRA